MENDNSTEEFIVDFGEVIDTSGGGGGTSDFNELSNRPKYNDSVMTGNTNIPKVPTKTSELTNDQNYQTGAEVQSAVSLATSGKQDKLTAGDNISISNNVISATDTTYTAGNGLDLTDTTFSVDTTEIATKSDLGGKQNTLTAGANITISDDTISATDTTYTAGNGIDITNEEISVDTQVVATQSDLSSKQDTLTAGSNITISSNTISATDTTYSAFTGTDGQTAGTSGLVPAPATTDADKFLKSDGTWDTAGGSTINVVQTVGTSQTDVMSQDAVTSMVFASSSDISSVRIGKSAEANSSNTVAIGREAKTKGPYSIAIGGDSLVDSSQNYGVAVGASCKIYGDSGVAAGFSAIVSGAKGVALGRAASATPNFSVGLGAGARPTLQGEVNVGTGSTYTTSGYNSSNYRLISGVYDGQGAHDAVTVAQVNATIDAINTALSTNVPHIGASS